MLSRPQLAQSIGVSRATIDTLANELLQIGLAVEEGLGTSTGGRPPVMLKFNPDAAYALGARMRDHTWSLVVTDLDAQILHKLNQPIRGSTPEAAVEALQVGVQEMYQRVDKQKILPAIGLGTPGWSTCRAG